MGTNTNTNAVTSELGSGDDACSGIFSSSLGYLALSLGFALLLVGALFYYVRQRIEVLETSQKEQIHVMQSFISSIGGQFQRMDSYIQQKLGGGSAPASSTSHMNFSPLGAKKDLIDISDDDDCRGGRCFKAGGSESESSSDSDSGSDSDSSCSDASRSSNTTRDSERDLRYTTKQIRIHPDDHQVAGDVYVGHGSNPNMDSIKVVEITDSHPASDDDSETESSSSSSASSSSSSDSDNSDSDTESEAGTKFATDDIIEIGQEIHVIKTAPEPQHDEAPVSNASQGQKKTMVLDLDIGPEVTITTTELKLTGDAETAVVAEATVVPDDSITIPSISDQQYSSLTIKQLRQLLKKKSPGIDADISKLKREQIIEIIRK
jgi:hypothetical protein